ncbi:uncharacterized protein LOC103938869 isoform X7 [Pyrus x bretschneideri]|uniref:uncharacterized protein LOC103938869 isoform X7 n=1 Tax=Pyrus x bretschneideri TaxID=225117 RepID=UPI00202F836B|nr:uncharacterized protein LOC103938869 isoform X7 [Pyrus x bretschneideri]
MASSPKQRTHLCVLHFRQFRITGSDLKWGIAAVVGELDHGDAEREGMAYIRSDQETVLKEGMFEDLSLANKQLRFVLIF